MSDEFAMLYSTKMYEPWISANDRVNEKEEQRFVTLFLHGAPFLKRIKGY